MKPAKLHVFLLVTMLLSTSFLPNPDQHPLLITIDARNTAQTIDNIGASGCWYMEEIGRYWPAATRQRIAELLFSRQTDARGNPKGIGLSAWRFNIGGGTAEQGDSSGMPDASKRVA